MTSAIIDVTAANFDAEVMKSDKLVLIDFHAVWCGPCKAMAPNLEKFAAENPHIKVVKIDVDQSPEIADQFKIRSIPTLVTFKDGRGLLGAVGNLPKKTIEKLVEQALQVAAANNIQTGKDAKGPEPKGPTP